MLRGNSLFALLLMLAALFAVGCGGSAESGQSIHVIGTVQLDGAPLSEGSIQFTSRQSGTTFPANLGSDGTYELELLGVDPGEEFDISVGSPLMNESDAAGGEVEVDSAGVPVTPPPPPVAERYLEPATSGLSVTLGEEATQTFDFDVTSN